MTKSVFISYRRADCAAEAQSAYDRLLRVLPKERVFLDKNSLPSGLEYPAHLEAGLQQCEMLVALIGAKWSVERLHDPRDLVRREIEVALNRNIPLVPVLLGGASLPKLEALPPELAALRRKQAVQANNVEGAFKQVMQGHRLGLADTAQIDRAVANHKDAITSARNVSSANMQTVRQRGSFADYETVMGLIDLTWFENANDFVAITDAGLHYRSGPDSGFVPYYELARANISLEGDRAIRAAGLRIDVSGVDAQEVYEAIRSLKQTTAGLA